jgi:hypothetical protein
MMPSGWKHTLLATMCAATGSIAGCQAPGVRLSFPPAPLEWTSEHRLYDVDGDTIVDFALMAGDDGRFELIAYDDDEDGEFDRTFRLSDHADEDVPHLIVLLDSVPFEPTRERYQADRWTWFEPPVKLIAPFPTMSGVIFSQIMGTGAIEGANNRYYDRTAGKRRDMIWARIWGYTNAWQRPLHYKASYIQNGLAFLEPRPWFAAELALTARTFERNPGRETIVYIASTSGMMSKFGAEGLDEILDGVERLALQVIHEREGAVKISVLSDHGHNLTAPTRIDLAPTLSEAGFRPASRLRRDEDVVIDIDGLVNFAGLHTHHPREVAEALIRREEVEVAMFEEDGRVVVLTQDGEAFVERQDGRDRWTSVVGDPLDYVRVVAELRAAGRLDADGFAARRDWFDATVDHEWPDAPGRVWDAFHGIVLNTPDVMLAIRDGYCVGDKSFERFIDMQSTHGGLNQINSATVLLTMRRGVNEPLRSEQVLEDIRTGDQP